MFDLGRIIYTGRKHILPDHFYINWTHLNGFSSDLNNSWSSLQHRNIIKIMIIFEMVITSYALFLVIKCFSSGLDFSWCFFSLLTAYEGPSWPYSLQLYVPRNHLCSRHSITESKRTEKSIIDTWNLCSTFTEMVRIFSFTSGKYCQLSLCLTFSTLFFCCSISVNIYMNSWQLTLSYHS